MRGKYVIAGIGHTKFGRLPGRGTVSMNVEACRNALADAGIEKSAVDALFVKVPTSRYSAMYGQTLNLKIPGYQVRKAIATDVEACNRLCRAIHGHDRDGDLRDAIAQGTANVVEHLGRISGYATGIGWSGHAIGETNQDLEALIAAAPMFQAPGFLVPTRNGELMRWWG